MNRPVLSRAVVLLLAATLLASPALAAGGRAPAREPGLLAAAWQLLVRIVPSLQKDGATSDDDSDGRQMIDPDGAATSTDSDGRHTIDPNG